MRSFMPCGLKCQSGPASTVFGMVDMERSWIYDATSKEEKTLFLKRAGRDRSRARSLDCLIEREGFFYEEMTSE